MGEVLSEKLYIYGTTWKDQLTSFDGSSITYDKAGNPLVYKGSTFEWQRGRLLSRVTDGNKQVLYFHDENGLVTSKTVVTPSESHIQTYKYNGDKLVSMHVTKNSLCETYSKKLIFVYTQSGVSGFMLDGKYYHYVKNHNGDVVLILDEVGNEIADYTYDAWGNCSVCTDGTDIGELNPIRYRGYFYDEDLGLYYLQSRYYDPQTGRFINADTLDYLEPESINGLNLYAYCYNNPINYVDPTGHMPFFILTAIIGAIIGVAITAAVDYIPDKEFNLHWGWYVGAGVIGALVGAGIGMAVSYYATGSIASSTGQVFTSLFKSTSLYRSVGPDELADLKATGKFRQGPNSMEGKFFANSKNGAMKWGKSFNQSSYVKIRVPKSSLSNSSVNAMKYLDAIDDAFYFSDLGYLNSIVEKIWFL